MLSFCTVIEKKIIDEVSGEVKNIIYHDYTIINKNNNCKYFKKKFFSKKQDKVICKNCKNWYVPGDPY